MNKIEDFQPICTPTSGKTKRAGDEVSQELWSIKAQINREANYDLATLAHRANATAVRLGFSAA